MPRCLCERPCYRILLFSQFWPIRTRTTLHEQLCEPIACWQVRASQSRALGARSPRADDWLQPQWASYQSLIGRNTVVLSAEIAEDSPHIGSFLSGTVVQLVLVSVPLRFSPPCARSPGKVADLTVCTTMEADSELSLVREASCEACHWSVDCCSCSCPDRPKLGELQYTG